MADNRFEIRIVKEADGSDATLENLSVAAAQSLAEILESLSKIAAYENQNNDVRIKVTKGSACAAIEAPSNKLVVIKDNIEKVTNYESEDEVYVKSLRNIQDVIKSNGLTYEAFLSDDTSVTNILDKFKQDRTFRKRRTVKKYVKKFHVEFFSGQLFAVGGKNPNIHIESAGESYPIDCDEKQAIVVNKFLYQNIKISTWAKVAEGKKPVYYFCDHYINETTYKTLKEFVQLNTGLSGTEIFKNIHYSILDFVQTQDFGGLRKFIRLFTSDFVDVQRQRAVLMTLKEFKNHEDIEDLYENLVELIESKTKKPIL